MIIRLELTLELFVEATTALSVAIEKYNQMVDVSIPASSPEDQEAIDGLKRQAAQWKSALNELYRQRRTQPFISE